MTEFTIFSAEGVTFTAKGKDLVAACKKAATTTADYEIIAVVASDAVVTPAAGKLTALIVNAPKQGLF